MLAALGFPGTATYDPEFHDRTLFVLGMHGQVFLAIILLVAVAATTVAAIVEPRGGQRATIGTR